MTVGGVISTPTVKLIVLIAHGLKTFFCRLDHHEPPNQTPQTKMDVGMQWLVHSLALIIIMGTVCPIEAAQLNGNGYTLVVAINDDVKTVTDFKGFLESMKVSVTQFL